MNEILTITQIVQVNGNGYVFFYPYGAPYSDIYDALKQLDEENRKKQAIAVEQIEKQKLQQEMKDSIDEAMSA